MASIIVADEKEGRRNLLAGTLEREGYDVTRAGTLRQCEGTALATMPDVVLMDGGWNTGDPIDTASRLSTDPEFALKCRILIVSSTSGEDYLVSAANAGVSEVMLKPVGMSALLVQLDKHAKKLFVPPPADIRKGTGSGFFEVSVTPGDPSWSLPILHDLLGEGAIDTRFVGDLLQRMNDEGVEIDIDEDKIHSLLRIAFDELILGAEVDLEGEEEIEKEDESLGDAELDLSEAVDEEGEPLEGDDLEAWREIHIAGLQVEREMQRRRERKVTARSRMVGAMDDRAKVIEAELDVQLERLMDPPDKVAILTEFTGMVPVDPNALRMTRLTLEIIRDLFWDMGVPVRENLGMYSTQLEDAQQLVVDSLEALPEPQDEEE